MSASERLTLLQEIQAYHDKLREFRAALNDHDRLTAIEELEDMLIASTVRFENEHAEYEAWLEERRREAEQDSWLAGFYGFDTDIQEAA